MKKYLVFVLVLVVSVFALYSHQALATGGWAVQTNSGVLSWTSIASSANGMKLAAVEGSTGNNIIYTSINGGIDWTPRTTPSVNGSSYWKSITSDSTGDKLAAVNWNGYIYTSINGGANWTEQTDSGVHRWISISSDSTGDELMASTVGGGSVYTSTNSGANWTIQPATTGHDWFSVAYSSDGNKLAAVVGGGSPGSIWTSTDGGFKWTEQTNAGTRTWASIASNLTGDKLAAVASSGLVYTSINSGADWTERNPAGAARNWKSISSDSTGDKLAAVAYGGFIYISTNGGDSWAQQTDAGGKNWNAIASDSTGDKLVAGVDGGHIYTYPTLPTADIGIALTTPTENGTKNHLTLDGTPHGSFTHNVNIDVVNGTNSVLFTVTKTKDQTIAVTGFEAPPRDDSLNVSVGGTDTNPIYTVNTTTPGDDVSSGGGNKTFLLTISETGKSDITYYVNIQVAEPAILESIAVTHGANKLSYTVGETLDITGLEVTGTYDDASNKIESITTENITGFNSLAPAIGQILTITVGGKTTTYVVDILAARVNHSSSGSYIPGHGSNINNSVNAPTLPVFNRVLKLKMIGDDVKALQNYLNTHGYPVATTGPGSLGHETTLFGLLTKKAVIKFQLANKLVGDGIVGPKTMEVLNK
jgi:hypothetical protein